MNMKNKIILAALACLSVVSCSDMLEIEQKGVVKEETYYSTDEDALSAFTVVYSTLNASNWFMDNSVRNVLSDDIYSAGGTRGDNANYEQLNEYNFAVNNAYIPGLYSFYYNVIYYSNVLLGKFSQGESDAKDRCIAEARVFRAWAHMQLATLWGNPPLIDHIFEGSSEYQQPNSDPQELWKFIIDELGEAAAKLPSKTGIDEPVVRLTKEVALSFRGKAQVLSGDYEGAKTSLKQVISSGLYGLVPTSALGELFTGKYDLCRETVYETNLVNNKSNVWFAFVNGPNMYGPRTDHLSGYPSGIYGIGWGFFNPRQEFIDEFRKNEEGSPRFNAWVRSWDDLLADGVSGIQGNSLYGCCGWFDWKFHVDQNDVPTEGYGYCWMKNPRWMRYAEVLLLYAEACAVAGDGDGSGLKALNDIQERAGAPKTSLSLDNVKKEKRFEMWMEGVRITDVIRWGDVGKTTLPEQGKYVPLFKGKASDGSYIVDKTTYTNENYGFKTGRHELLPYPEVETISNSKIVQNPGWGTEN